MMLGDEDVIITDPDRVIAGSTAREIQTWYEERMEAGRRDVEERRSRGENIIWISPEQQEEEERRRKEYAEWARPFMHLSEEDRQKERKRFLYRKRREDPAFLEKEREKARTYYANNRDKIAVRDKIRRDELFVCR
jgi:hypothetical protein